MTDKFDVIVLGTGSAGGKVAHTCRQAGWKVAVIESGSPGGTCAQRGCDAKKPLVNAAGIIAAVQRLQGLGIRGDAAVDWQDLIAFKKTFTDPIAQQERERLDKDGIELIEGDAHFLNGDTLQIKGRKLSAGKFVIATGLQPRELHMQGEHLLTTSDEFLELQELPREMLFIGGGYISFEFAHVVARAGVKTTIVEQMDRVLRGFDPDLVQQLLAASLAAGIDVKLKRCADMLKRVDGKLQVNCRNSSEHYRTEMVLHGAGRTPSVKGLALDKADVEVTPRGIKVNDYLQSTSNPAFYAAGDVSDTMGPPLTPTANLEGRIAAHNLLHGNELKPDYTGIPATVYTIPSLASVGMQEEEALAKGLDVEVRYEDLSHRKPLRQQNVRHAAFKLIIDKHTDRILGAHLLMPYAQDLISVFALAIRLRLPLTEMEKVIPAYPSWTAMLNYML